MERMDHVEWMSVPSGRKFHLCRAAVLHFTSWGVEWSGVAGTKVHNCIFAAPGFLELLLTSRRSLVS